MIIEEMKERILKQLTLKPRVLIHGENIANNSGLYGDGKNVWGVAQQGIRGDVTDAKGDVSGIEPEDGDGDISRFVGCMTGIQASVPEIIALLEDAGKVIKKRAV